MLNPLKAACMSIKLQAQLRYKKNQTTDSHPWSGSLMSYRRLVYELVSSAADFRKKDNSLRSSVPNIHIPCFAIVLNVIEFVLIHFDIHVCRILRHFFHDIICRDIASHR